MDVAKTPNSSQSTKSTAALALSGALLLWVSQPPWCLWPLAFVALIPWLLLIVAAERPLVRRQWVVIWLAGFVYWAISLQGLRHAHPVIYVGWIALAGYLAIYPLVFVIVCRRLIARGVPICLSAPIAWVGGELLRNYLLTGISAAMLGHTMADVPMMIQIADLFGSYGVSFVVVIVNVAVLQNVVILLGRRGSEIQQRSSDDAIQPTVSPRSAVASLIVAAVLISATLGYGFVRLGQPLEEELATFALIQRNEHVEFRQDEQRELEMFDHYKRQSITAVAGSSQDIDAIVWPESMFTGALPWMEAERDAKPSAASQLTLTEFIRLIDENRGVFVQRALEVDDAIARSRTPYKSRHLIGGCGVVKYGQFAEVFSGMVHVNAMNIKDSISNSSAVPVQWYGKTHLVMIGEYIPFVAYIPGLRDYVKKIGLGLTTGPGPRRFMVNGTSVAPNICIETAVERVTVNHLAQLRSSEGMPDVVVTVTNDGWFDNSSVIDHHLRCAQLVAVGCRRPILSAANNAPTAWIDSNGQIAGQLTRGTNGSLIATPMRDNRQSLYLTIGDWPARVLGLICIVVLIDSYLATRRQRKKLPDANRLEGTQASD